MKKTIKKITIFIAICAFLVSAHVISAAEDVGTWTFQASSDFSTISGRDFYDFLGNTTKFKAYERYPSLSGIRVIPYYGTEPTTNTDYKAPYLNMRMFMTLRENSGEQYIRGSYQAYPPSFGMFIPSDFPPSTTVPAITYSESGDWSHRELTYAYGTKQYKVLVSRLSPAILFTSNSTDLWLFKGKKLTYTKVENTTWQGTSLTTTTTNPKYYAIPTTTGVVVRTADANGAVSLTGMNQNWMLVWYGDNSYLWGTNDVTFLTGRAAGNLSLASKWLKKVDLPLLIVFEKKPQTVQIDAANGGVQLQYGSETVGQVALMPLLGEQHPHVLKTDARDPNDPRQSTEGWNTALPASIATHAQTWYKRLGKYPVSVAESYTVNPTTKDVTISNAFTYRDLHTDPTRVTFAPIPPTLIVAKENGLNTNITFTGNPPVQDTNTPLTIGPIKGIDNPTIITTNPFTASYSYTVSGLSKYALGERVINANTNEPDDLLTKLNQQIQSVTANTNTCISSGDWKPCHLRPWWPIFSKTRVYFDMLIWQQPWETLYYLGNAVPLTSSTLQSTLKTYLSKERVNYSPETYTWPVPTAGYNDELLHPDEGKGREQYSTTPNLPYYPSVQISRFHNLRSLMSLYALADYYKYNPDLSELTTKWDGLLQILKIMVMKSEWSTMGMGPSPIVGAASLDIMAGGISDGNINVAGAIGTIRLARMKSDTKTEDFGHYLLSKSLINRLAQDKIVKYLYENGLQQIPPNQPDWVIKNSVTGGGEAGNSILWRRYWTGYQHDVRKPGQFDAYGTQLRDFGMNRTGHELIAYTNLTPELGRFLGTYAQEEAREWVKAIEENNPTWYETYTDNYLAAELSLALPLNAYQIFTAKSWILGETPDKLQQFTDIPWVSLGDYYYITKLTETIKAYRGWTWSDGSSPPPKPGDVNGDGLVNKDDMVKLLGEYGKTVSALNIVLSLVNF